MVIDVVSTGGGDAGVIAANRLAPAQADTTRIPVVNPCDRFVERAPIHQYAAEEINDATTAKEPIEDGYRAALELSMMLPEGAAGATLGFRTIQSCEFGENAWVQIADDGGAPSCWTHQPSPLRLSRTVSSQRPATASPPERRRGRATSLWTLRPHGMRPLSSSPLSSSVPSA